MSERGISPVTAPAAGWIVLILNTAGCHIFGKFQLAGCHAFEKFLSVDCSFSYYVYCPPCQFFGWPGHSLPFVPPQSYLPP